MFIPAQNTVAQAPEATSGNSLKYWNREELYQAPAWRDADDGIGEAAEGQRRILYQGMEMEGRRDDVFAYVGYPSSPMPENGYPGIVMVQGGEGTAYHNYARYWNNLGYATIAMDLYNSFPEMIEPSDRVHRKALPGQKFVEFGGTPEASAQVIKSIGNAVLGHSLLRSLPKVDVRRIGMVGISWGSVFCSVVAALDDRLRIIVPVYGHGFNELGDGSQSFYRMASAPWDPKYYLHEAKSPLHWIGGTNDAAFSMLAMQRSYDEAPTTQNHSYLIELLHGHCGYRFPVVRRIMEGALQNGVPLPRLGKAVCQDGRMTAEILERGRGIAKAVLSYTQDECECVKRRWHEAPAEVQEGVVSSVIPEGATIAYLNLFDQQEEDGSWNCCGSSNAAFLKPIALGAYHPTAPNHYPAVQMD